MTTLILSIGKYELWQMNLKLVSHFLKRFIPFGGHGKGTPQDESQGAT